MTTRYKIALFLLIALCAVLGVSASPPSTMTLGTGFDYELFLEPAQPCVGEPFTLKVHLKTENASDVTLDPNYLADGATTWVRVSSSSFRRAHSEGKNSVFAIELVGLFPGVQPLPPIKVFKQGQEVGAVHLGEIELTSHLSASEETTLPTKLSLSPAETSLVQHPLIQRKREILWGLAGLMGLAVAIAAWTLLRRRMAAPPPPLPPDAQALAMLDQLAAEELIAKRQIKEFYSRLSDTVRDYLGTLFGFDGLEMTTSELLEALEGKPVPPEVREEITAVLQEADLVKFARYRPATPVCERALQRAREIIRRLPPPRAATEGGRGPERVAL